MKSRASKSRRTVPLNCPKGYGLCWTCETWCDMDARNDKVIEDDADREMFGDNDFGLENVGNK